MPDDPSAQNAAPWWRSVPAILTAAATFIGAVAALLALFVGSGDRTTGSNVGGSATHPPPTTPITQPPTSNEGPTISLKNESEANVRNLLALVPASLQSRCVHAPDAGGGDELASLSCEIGGATFYYYLFPDELDALNSFRIGVSNADGSFLGNEPTEHARSCAEAGVDRPFVGPWTRGGGSGPAGQRLCVQSFADSIHIDWTETGRPILGEMYYNGSLDAAELVWDRVVRG